MKKRVLFFAVLIAMAITAGAQTYYPGKVRVIVNDAAIIPQEGHGSENAAFAAVLGNFGVTEITQPLSFAKTPELRRLYELNTSLSEDALFEALNEINTGNSLFLSVEKCPVPETMYDPVDYMWWLTNNDPTHPWLWHLKKMQADLAWDITKGCPDVIVAITDSGLDTTHPDLATKFYPRHPFHAPPGTPFYVGGHGTAVASLVAAETIDAGQPQNAGALASVGYNTRFMLDGMSTDNCLYASTVLAAPILTLSWHHTTCIAYTSELLAEQEILDNGTTIVRAAGNGAIHCGGNKVYPFSGSEDPRTIVVSSTGRDDKHFDTYGAGGGTHSHYKEVDLCAPGYGVELATPPQANGYQYMPGGGTSYATPQVAGVAALMYCVNPCLASAVCQDILKNTTDPIVDAASYAGKVGTGRVNAFKAVKAAQGMLHSAIDLYIKDRPEDLGYGVAGNFPYHWQAARDKSPDIWVRNQPDGLINQVNQNPVYSSQQPVYVYVRVWNKSCTESDGEGLLKLYWTKACTNSSWPANWDGSSPFVGDLIDTQVIPNIKQGQCTILQFQWNVLDPNSHQNWSTCLLARIESIPMDPITAYPNNLSDEVFFNNNIAMRNVSVLAGPPGGNPPGFVAIRNMSRGSFMYIGNVDRDPKSYDIRFGLPVDEASPSIVQEGEVHIFTDNQGWEILEPALAAAGNDKVRKVGENHFMLLQDEVILTNVEFPAETRAQIYVGFNFLTDHATPAGEYLYQVLQSYKDPDPHLTGTENFIIEKDARTPFYANGGEDKIIHAGESVLLNAVDIGEPAIYNWYAADHSFIQSGKDLNVNPGSSSSYILEVISETDRYKDYDQVNVNVKQFWIEQIVPNPTDAGTVVSYSIGAASAQLKVYNQSGTLLNTYALPQNSTSREINVAGYVPGTYSIILEVNGNDIDAKTLIVQ